MSTDQKLDWEWDVLTSDGRPVHIRPIRPDDADALVAFHRGLSPDTVYSRFFGVHPRLSEAEIQRFTHVDQQDRVALVVLDDERLVAVGRFDRIPQRPDEAEVAFVVDDAHQGHGIGTLLLEHLAAIAADRHVERLVAQVMPGNRRMLAMFQASGFEATQHLTTDVVEVTLPVRPSATAEAAIEAREHEAERSSIRRLLRPRSIAVIGASRKPGSVGHELLASLFDGGFEGPIYAVNAAGGDIDGLPAFRSVLDIPEPVDLAVIAVPATAVPGVVDECAHRQVGGLLVVSAGFAEADDDGRARQDAVVDLARQHGMRMVGPNCIGLVDTAVRLDATFAPFRAQPGNVAFLSQSGALGIALLERSTALGLGVSSFVSVGNKADVSGNDLLQYWEDDVRTEVILLYLESFGNPRKFARLARRVSRRKPIVALKSGRSAAGRRAAGSHTAALASPDHAVDALFAQTGVIRVDTLTELFETATLLAWQPLPAGPRVAIVGNSGGPETMATDALEAHGLRLAEPDETTMRRIRSLLPDAAAATAANPFDLLASAGPQVIEQVAAALLADDGVDAVVVVATPVLSTTADALANAVARATIGTRKPVLTCILAVPESPATLRRAHIPWYSSPEAAVRALAHAAAYVRWRDRDAGTVPPLEDIDPEQAAHLVGRGAPDGPRTGWLAPTDAQALLAIYGIEVVTTVHAPDARDAAHKARALGFPVALKSADPALVHKTDVGAVHLDLRSARDVRQAADAITRALGGDDDVHAGFVVQPMVADGVEMIAGIVQDPAFGPLVMVGAGGVTAELLGDRSVSILPLTDRDAHDMVRSLRLAPLLRGYRGRPPVAVDRLEDLLCRLAQLADDHPEIAELDCNPVVVTPTRACVVDAKIRLQAPTPHAPTTLRHLP